MHIDLVDVKRRIYLFPVEVLGTPPPSRIKVVTAATGGSMVGDVSSDLGGPKLGEMSDEKWQWCKYPTSADISRRLADLFTLQREDK